MDFAPDARSEEALARATRSGDPLAWEALFHRHFDGLYAFVRMRARGDQDLIDDVVQECWLVAVRRVKDFDPRQGDFGGWLRGIAENALRSERRRRERSLGLDDAGALAAPEVTPAHASLEEGNELLVALAALPEAYQDVLKAKYMEELSMVQIAERSGATVKAVESLLTRARGALREAIQRLSKQDD